MGPLADLVARWLSKLPYTGTVRVCGTRHWAIYTCIVRMTVTFIPGKESKYRTVRLNTGYLATLSVEPLSVSSTRPVQCTSRRCV